MDLEENVPDYIVGRIKNSHRIKKELWEHFYPILEYYCKQDGQNLTDLSLAEKYLEFIVFIDKSGDMFRYPISKSLELNHLLNKDLDLKNIYMWFNEIIEFLYAVDAWLDHIRNLERDLRTYYDEY